MSRTVWSPGLANAALPLVRRITTDLADLQTRAASLVAAYQEEHRRASPSQVVLNDTKREISAAAAQQDACVEELAALGVELKDAATGLVDFPAVLEGAPVLLCWRLGEERVEYFHTETDGFAGRKPIPIPEHVG
jgi:hypothetical protein